MKRRIPGIDFCANRDRTCNGPSMTERFIRGGFRGMGMYGGTEFTTFMTIEFIGAFEAFGSHNSWGHGWLVTITQKNSTVFDPPIKVKSECLDCAIRKAINKMERRLE